MSSRRPPSFWPRRSDFDIARSWTDDVVAGVTVAVVALPLALGFGVTTGLGAGPGLVTAIVAGAVAGLLGGSNVQVSGPTGAMTVVLVPIVHRYGPRAVTTVGLLAGVLIVAASLCHLGRYLAFIPWPVVEGFTVGIATIIFLQQVPSVFGVTRPEGDNTLVVAVRTIAVSTSEKALPALAVAVGVALVMVVLPRVRRSLPASLLAIAVLTALSTALDLELATIGALPERLFDVGLPAVSMSTVSELIPSALAVAVLAAIESLLSAKVADGLSDTGTHDPDRELFGQGWANVAASVLGGMPATGAIARTAVNIRAGARTRLAAIVHAAVLLVTVLVGGGLVEQIPLAALGGALMVTAGRMVERHNVSAVVRSTRSDAVVFTVTASATVAFDLIVALEVGIVVASLFALRHVAAAASVAATPVEVDSETQHGLLDQQILVYRLEGALFFGAAQRFLTELTDVTDVRVVILRMPAVHVLDATGAHTLGTIIRELEDRNITVMLEGLRPDHDRTLRATGAIGHLATESHLFDDLPTAVAHAREHAARSEEISPASTDAGVRDWQGPEASRADG